MIIIQGKEQFPDRKISETFLDFAAPFLTGIPKNGAKWEYESVLKIAFVVWNAVVYADATNDNTYLSEMWRLVETEMNSRLIFESMIARKRELFGNDHRLVGEYKVTMERGGLRLWAEARTPHRERGKQGEHPAACDGDKLRV
jgi:hypothetical protein